MSFKLDYKKGIKNEFNLLNKLIKIDNSIKKTNNPMCAIDFYSKSFLYELKTRNNQLNTYPTTMIGLNKLLFADKLNKPLIMIFSFTDGDYYCKYSKNHKLNFTVNKFVRNYRGDFKDKLADYVYIPISELKPLDVLKHEFDCPTSTV